jgi:hypothetical protein
MEDLKNSIRAYRRVDDELRELNRLVYEKRDVRKTIELEITDIIKAPEFAGFRKVKIEEDGSTISIKRPDEWTKPWSLSQKDLKDLATQYFAIAGEFNAESLVKFIVDTRKRDLVATEFSLTRTVPGEE